MGKIIKAAYVEKEKISDKQYKWFIPKALDGKVEKGDIVLVRAGKEKNRKFCWAQVVDILDNDKYNYEPVIKIISKKPKEVTKRKSKFSDEDKEQIKEYRAEGKTLKAIEEMYSCAISTIHNIVKS